MEKLSVLLMPILLISTLLIIVAIVSILFSDKIDMAVKGDKQVKKVIVVFSIGASAVCMIAIMAGILS